MMSIVMGAERDKYILNFEETELRLGLPGGGGGGNDGEAAGKSGGKRGFLETVDLKLNLVSKESSGADHGVTEKKSNEKKSAADLSNPPAKAQVVGWPPVRSCRKNIIGNQKNNTDEGEKASSGAQVVGWPPVRSYRKNIIGNQKNNTDEGEKASSGAAFVKVSMDGAPYLRKVDLKMYKSYQELSDALGKMFSSFTIGNCGSQGMKDFMNESKLIDLLNGSEYVPAYEDKDGDWMLVGDVPWEMFVDSCKRLRIMKGSEAIGLAPRAVEKCKNRS